MSKDVNKSEMKKKEKLEAKKRLEQRKAEKKKRIKFWTIIKVMLPKCFKEIPLAWTLLLVFNATFAILNVAIVYVNQLFFETATELSDGKRTIGYAIAMLVFMMSMIAVKQLANFITNLFGNQIHSKMSGVLFKQLQGKISNLPPIDFEETIKLDNINKATMGVYNAVDFMIRVSSLVTFYTIYIILMAVYLFSLNKLLALAIIFAFVPNLLSQLIRIRVFDKLEDKSAPVRRQYDYYEECLTSREYFKETRLLGAFSYFNRLYMQALDKLQKMKYKVQFKVAWMDFGLSFLSILGYGGVLYLLVVSMLDGDISVGAFAAVYASVDRLYETIEDMIRYEIGNMSNEYGTINNYINFLKLPEDNGKRYTVPNDISIDLENVSFAYPSPKDEIGAVASMEFKWDHYGNLIDADLLKDVDEKDKMTKDVIKNVNLHINAGETIAIVGENGSGKSTIIRLITGLYKPREGTVKYNGEDISEYKCSDVYAKTSAVFQKYQRYQMTLGENIEISDTKNETKEEDLNEVCKLAGLHIDEKTYPDGFDTMLSREFEGVDLSGGQWQRVAIARAFNRKHSLIVLDEPTSAIDPYEETRIYNEFAKISKDKTSIIVTHRLGSVKLADRIVVMKKGSVVEVGTHEELIKNDGEYRRLYTSQEQWYSN